jgi:DNA-binding GntR family transcriptional regulator
MTSQVFTPVALLAPEHAELAVRQHGDIAAAVLDGDAAAAERLARKHIRTTIERLTADEKAGKND